MVTVCLLIAFSAHCHSLIMIVNMAIRSRLVGDNSQSTSEAESESTSDDDESEVRTHAETKLLIEALIHASQGVRILTHHRQTYGVKIVPPALFETSMIAASALLQGLQLSQQDASNAQLRNAGILPHQIEDTFNECLRFLLASAVQHTMTQAITRMLLVSSQQLQVCDDSLHARCN